MGNAGRTSVRVGRRESSVEFPSFANALQSLAAEAAREVNAAGNVGFTVPEYLIDDEGATLVDTSDSVARAQILLEHLRDDFWREAAEAAEAEEWW